jgi:nickel-dependent lactate racemase
MTTLYKEDMMNKFLITLEKGSICQDEIEKQIDILIDQCKLNDIKKILIMPPDFTRCYSMAGDITQILYHKLSPSCHVDIMPAIGTHMAMNEEELEKMFGNEIPRDAFIVHDWRNDTVSLGLVPKKFVNKLSQGLFNEDIEVEVNKRLISGEYGLILSVGQVVPHEVVGMANYSKNIFVGCGGRQMINKSHMLSAICGMEKAMGVQDTPARLVFDYAQEHYIADLPLIYIQTVTTMKNNKVELNGLYIGNERTVFEQAVKLSQKLNITYVGKPFQKVVAYLDEHELKTTWVWNKGIYRTRKIVADGGELILLAPGIRSFGENEEVNRAICKYGYKGRDYVLNLYNTVPEIKNNMMVAAHLIQGSSDERFTITYATQHLTKEEIEGVGFNYMPLSEAYKLYDPEKLEDGYNILENGEEIYFVRTPAMGLWTI